MGGGHRGEQYWCCGLTKSLLWKLAFPDQLKGIGLPFDDAYALAVQMRGR